MEENLKERLFDKKDIGFEIERYFLQEVIKLLSNLKSPVYEDIQEDTTPYYNILISLLLDISKIAKKVAIT